MKEARLHKEIQFNRKVALHAELRELKAEIDRLASRPETADGRDMLANRPARVNNKSYFLSYQWSFR